MENVIREYINSQRIGVLAVGLPDGSPHAATVHFAFRAEPAAFYFVTGNDTRKAQALAGRSSVAASFVIGTDESTMKTLQLDGVLEIVKAAEEEDFKDAYLGRFPEKIEKTRDPETVWLRFTPQWWRYTDYKAPQGPLIISSDDK